ncbi:hypothetical protein Dimus_013582 [Dionaea muscipula]
MEDLRPSTVIHQQWWLATGKEPSRPATLTIVEDHHGSARQALVGHRTRPSRFVGLRSSAARPGSPEQHPFARYRPPTRPTLTITTRQHHLDSGDNCTHQQQPDGDDNRRPSAASTSYDTTSAKSIITSHRRSMPSNRGRWRQWLPYTSTPHGSMDQNWQREMKSNFPSYWVANHLGKSKTRLI